MSREGINLPGRFAEVTLLLMIGGAFAACQSPSSLVGPTSVGGSALAGSASQSGDRCMNVFAQGTAPLGFVALPNGTAGFGGMWFPVSLGPVNGEMASVVVGQETSGQQGAQHLTLEHAFRTLTGDYFITRDRAVCAPAGTNPATCRVNDVLVITEGTGIFTNANGSLRNHGVVDFGAGTLDFSMRGRVCGDGL